MPKTKQLFFCKECGYESPKWMGQCPACKEWNTFTEAPVSGKKNGAFRNGAVRGVGVIGAPVKPSRINDVDVSDEDRYVTGIGEFDRVLGGGIVKGSLTLVGGDPGIGKSTLLLQVCGKLAADGRKVFYVSGEESLKQIKMRADRIGEFGDSLLLLSETSLDIVEELIFGGLNFEKSASAENTDQIETEMSESANSGKAQKPDIIVIDSIQTIYREDIDAAPGSVSQVRECTASLLKIAKQEGISVFIVGHVTKEGVVAGPRMLEHMVDTVLYFEGDNVAVYRMLRAVKNRFGSTNELGVFEMKGNGLCEVINPSEYMLQGRPEEEPGSVITCAIEGTRPIMAEVQALVSRTSFNYPRRTAVGVDLNRVTLLMAVMEKRMGVQLGDHDAYVNVAGGMRVNEPSLDLAVVSAILSSFRNRCIAPDISIFGEVGLVGEVRGVSMAAKRAAEALKMGYDTVIMPKANLDQVKDIPIRCIGIQNIRELSDYV